MIGAVVGMGACWLLCELVGGIVGEGIVEAILWLVPKRITPLGAIAGWLLAFVAMGGAVAWWRADPASDFRTRLACFCCVAMPVAGVLLSASVTPRPERLPRGRAGGGLLRNDRLRVR